MEKKKNETLQNKIQFNLNNKMKAIYILLVCIFISADAFPQLGIKAFYFMPRGELGQVMKKNVGFEILKKEDFESSSFRLRYGVDFIPLKPRLDTFPAYAIRSDNNTAVLPGYISYDFCMTADMFFGMDFKILNEDKFNPYAGGDLIAGVMIYNYYKKIYGSSDGKVNDGELFFSVRLRIGAEYNFSSRSGLFFDLSSALYITESRFLCHYEAGLGISYRLRE